MQQSHYVVFKNASGQTERHPLKAWLREHLEVLPEAEDGSKTSHTLREALRKIGWVRKDTPESVLMIRPDENSDISFADALLDAYAEAAEIEDAIEDAAEITFGLERDLQLALRAHIDQLESGLTIIDGGKERHTEAGRIDITAQDDKDCLVAIELKAGTATPDVIAQILAYMSSLGAETGKEVRGIIVAGDFHRRVVLAARSVSNLRLMKYSFRFDFGDVE